MSYRMRFYRGVSVSSEPFEYSDPWRIGEDALAIVHRPAFLRRAPRMGAAVTLSKPLRFYAGRAESQSAVCSVTALELHPAPQALSETGARFIIVGTMKNAHNSIQARPTIKRTDQNNRSEST